MTELYSSVPLLLFVLL